jgi:hypothetical protein
VGHLHLLHRPACPSARCPPRAAAQSRSRCLSIGGSSSRRFRVVCVTAQQICQCFDLAFREHGVATRQGNWGGFLSLALSGDTRAEDTSGPVSPRAVIRPRMQCPRALSAIGETASKNPPADAG